MKTETWKLYHTDGEVTSFKVPSGQNQDDQFARISALQEAVGGFFESVNLGGRKLAYVNEEGRLNGMVVNTGIYDKFGIVVFGPLILRGK